MKKNESDLWIEGAVRAFGNMYHYWAKRYETGSEFGIDGGRISKLRVERKGCVVCSYERGWEQRPVDEDTQFVLEIILHGNN